MNMNLPLVAIAQPSAEIESIGPKYYCNFLGFCVARWCRTSGEIFGTPWDPIYGESFLAESAEVWLERCRAHWPELPADLPPLEDPLDMVGIEVETQLAQVEWVELLTLDALLDEVHRRGGGISSLPSGSVKVYLPAPGYKWKTKQTKLRVGESLSEALRRAINEALARDRS